MHKRASFSVSIPRKTHSGVAANLAGPALTEKLFSSPKRMLGRNARNVTDPKKKRARIVRPRPFGAVWTDRWPRLLRRNVAHEVATPTVPSKKLAETVKGKPAGRALTAGSFNSLRRRPGPEASSVTVPDRKRPSIVVVKGRPRGRDSLRVAAIHMKMAPDREAHHLGPKASPGLDQRRPGNGFH